jgi:uncharacterized protein (DUF1330 family)
LKHYAIVEFDITNSEWVPGYLKNVTSMVEHAGGKFLARTSDIELIEGEQLPETIVIIEFPSKESFDRFYNSEEYKPFKQSRRAGSYGNFYMVAGEDIAAQKQD